GKAVRISEVRHGATDSLVVTDVPKLPDGTYVVTFRVTSLDSHPIQGAFTFGVGRAAGSAATVAQYLSGRGGNRTVGVLFATVRALAFLSTLVLIGGVACRRWLWPEPLWQRETRRYVFGALALVIITALAGVAFQAAYA